MFINTIKRRSETNLHDKFITETVRAGRVVDPKVQELRKSTKVLFQPPINNGNQ